MPKQHAEVASYTMDPGNNSVISKYNKLWGIELKESIVKSWNLSSSTPMNCGRGRQGSPLQNFPIERGGTHCRSAKNRKVNWPNRWLEQLQEFNFQITHHRGRSHGNADALSQRPCNQCGHLQGTLDEEPSKPVCLVVESPRGPAIEPGSIQHIRQLQLDDETMGAVLNSRELVRKPSPDDIAGKYLCTAVGPPSSQKWDAVQTT